MNEDIKKIIKNEIAPLLIGIRNDLEDNKKATQELSEEVKKKSTLEYTLEVDDLNYKGDKGDSPTDQQLLELIIPLIPKKGKDFFTNKDIKDVVADVYKLLPSKAELKGKDGVIDYSLVSTLASPIIEKKYKDLKKEIKDVSDELFETISKATNPKVTATQIREELKKIKTP